MIYSKERNVIYKMKKFKKSEIAIYAMSLMLVAAGYFNYVTFDNEKTKEVYSEDIEEISNQYANVGDAVLVSSNEIKDNENMTQDNNQEIENKENQTNSEENTNLEEKIIDTNTDNSDYYVASKLDREKMYAEMISNYEKFLNNANITELQKNMLSEEITKINNTKNAIMICENLILTKGFNNCIILVNEDSVNVIVNITGGLNTESVAKIQNIISRELNTQIENIHITEK